VGPAYTFDTVSRHQADNDGQAGGDAESQLVATRGSDRPRRRDGSSGIEERIFTATEELLGEIGLVELGAAEICRRADVARGTFYFYFSSKYAVVAGLLAQVMDEIFEAMLPFAARQNTSPVQALHDGLSAGWEVWRRHRLLLRATCEHWASVDELRELWLSVMGRFTEAIAHEIDRERSAGLASEGIDSRRLASMLIWSAERHAYVAGLGLDPELPNETAIFKDVLEFWTRAIYGVIPAATDSG
jgi:AcrR family transcriptional regulator